MVDLVKIRRKAREKSLAKAATAAADHDSSEGHQSQVTAGVSMDPAESAQLRLERFKASLGTNRKIAATAAAVDGASVGAKLELLVFSMGGEQYAVPIETIAEIIEPRAETPVPNSDPAVLGIISLRGTIVTIVDAGRKLGHPGAGSGVDARTIVIERDGELTGFKVDRIFRVVTVAQSEIEKTPLLQSGEKASGRSDFGGSVVVGVFRLGESLSILLSLDELLA